MTGLLAHNHGVLWVTHTVDSDQGRLRTDHPHWVQRLTDAGYRTGYFGTWHVEHDEDPAAFGWQTDGSMRSELFRERAASMPRAEQEYELARYHDGPPGYRRQLHYGVTNRPPEQRNMGLVTELADRWLRKRLAESDPCCCFVSLTEPHDPFVCGREAYTRYDVDALPVPASARDDLAEPSGSLRKGGPAMALAHRPGAPRGDGVLLRVHYRDRRVVRPITRPARAGGSTGADDHHLYQRSW